MSIHYLSKKIYNFDRFNYNGDTPLCLACRIGNYNIVEYLINKGCDVQLTDIRKLSPLHHAKINKKNKIIELLLNFNAK